MWRLQASSVAIWFTYRINQNGAAVFRLSQLIKCVAKIYWRYLLKIFLTYSSILGAHLVKRRLKGGWDFLLSRTFGSGSEVTACLLWQRHWRALVIISTNNIVKIVIFVIFQLLEYRIYQVYSILAIYFKKDKIYVKFWNTIAFFHLRQSRCHHDDIALILFCKQDTLWLWNSGQMCIKLIIIDQGLFQFHMEDYYFG